MSLGTALVTGASSGIGEATARHLDSLGFTVFAGVRKPADAERIDAAGSERLRALELDVTDPRWPQPPTIWDKGTDTADAMLAKAPPEAEQLYGGLTRSMRAEAHQIATDTGVEPEVVARRPAGPSPPNGRGSATSLAATRRPATPPTVCCPTARSTR